jgi:hypothetical protein
MNDSEENTSRVSSRGRRQVLNVFVTIDAGEVTEQNQERPAFAEVSLVLSNSDHEISYEGLSSVSYSSTMEIVVLTEMQRYCEAKHP